jgi:hypothetical protein
VSAVVKIKTEKAAWLAAVSGIGAAIIGTAALWPLMKRMVAKYDRQHGGGKDSTDIVIDAGGKFKDVEEDEFQKKVDRALAAKEVDPNDKSIGAYLTRFRCVGQCSVWLWRLCSTRTAFCMHQVPISCLSVWNRLVADRTSMLCCILLEYCLPACMHARAMHGLPECILAPPCRRAL